MMLSQRARYALRALIELVETYQLRPVAARELAERTSAPLKFLESALLDLKRHGVLISLRGYQGGYFLARPPEDITFAEILRIVDGPFEFAQCTSDTLDAPCQTCPDKRTCKIHPAVAELQAAASRILSDWTLRKAHLARLTVS